MPEEIRSLLEGVAWPVALAVAWVAGELGQRWLRLPRISCYGIAGFAMASGQGGFLPDPSGQAFAFLADFAFGLILFELGYRINLAWLRFNPWLGVTSVVEASATFVAVFAVATFFDVQIVPALLLSSIAMSTSPAAVVRVINESGGSGQVTERTLHLSAFNCILAAVAFKVIVGYWVAASAGDIPHALWNSVVLVAVSVALGALGGVAVPALLRAVGSAERDATIAFALGVLILTGATHALRFSPLLATLAFGLVARSRRVVLSQAQRNFGALGDLLVVLLFVFVSATLDGRRVVEGAQLALAVVGARLAAKTVATTLLARASGITLRKGVLTGLALTPLSVFAILLLEQTRHFRLGLLDDVAAVAGVVLVLEIFGPLVTRIALAWAGEARTRTGGGRGT